MIGQTYNNWTIIENVVFDQKRRKHVVVKCVCGTVTKTQLSDIISGKSKRCLKCYHEEQKITRKGHGLCDTRSHTSWIQMIQRCNNPKNPGYKNYGGRGIFVCERWRNFINFYEDMGERPEGLVLDRTNNDDGYYKENCQWVSRSQSCYNRRKFKKRSNLQLLADIHDKKFGSLFVLKFNKYVNGVHFYDCLCDCGKIVSIERHELKKLRKTACKECSAERKSQKLKASYALRRKREE